MGNLKKKKLVLCCVVKCVLVLKLSVALDPLYWVVCVSTIAQIFWVWRMFLKNRQHRNYMYSVLELIVL